MKKTRNKFLDFVHDVTHLGYEKKITISVKYYPYFVELFNAGKTPAEALQLFIDKPKI